MNSQPIIIVVPGNVPASAFSNGTQAGGTALQPTGVNPFSAFNNYQSGGAATAAPVMDQSASLQVCQAFYQYCMQMFSQMFSSNPAQLMQLMQGMMGGGSLPSGGVSGGSTTPAPSTGGGGAYAPSFPAQPAQSGSGATAVATGNPAAPVAINGSVMGPVIVVPVAGNAAKSDYEQALLNPLYLYDLAQKNQLQNFMAQRTDGEVLALVGAASGKYQDEVESGKPNTESLQKLNEVREFLTEEVVTREEKDKNAAGEEGKTGETSGEGSGETAETEGSGETGKTDDSAGEGSGETGKTGGETKKPDAATPAGKVEALVNDENGLSGETKANHESDISEIKKDPALLAALNQRIAEGYKAKGTSPDKAAIVRKDIPEGLSEKEKQEIEKDIAAANDLLDSSDGKSYLSADDLSTLESDKNVRQELNCILKDLGVASKFKCIRPEDEDGKDASTEEAKLPIPDAVAEKVCAIRENLVNKKLTPEERNRIADIIQAAGDADQLAALREQLGAETLEKQIQEKFDDKGNENSKRTRVLLDLYADDVKKQGEIIHERFEYHREHYLWTDPSAIHNIRKDVLSNFFLNLRANTDKARDFANQYPGGYAALKEDLDLWRRQGAFAFDDKEAVKAIEDFKSKMEDSTGEDRVAPSTEESHE